ncbi:NUDIX hydrolase [Candidatus Parcubacteria bacterium]|nr:NUDIX hydrolase [Candidatus Parcubacteria bacterium]
MKQFIATKAIVHHNGKILLLQESERYKDGALGKTFCVPGGRIEPGERLHDALLREVKEETGLIVRIKRQLGVGEWNPVVGGEHWHIVGVFFECEADTDKVALSDDHAAYEWIEPAAYRSYELPDNLYPIFDEHYASR